MSLYGSLKWIGSNGGPLLLLEERLLDKWRGVHVKNSSVLESDYDRADAVEGYIGLTSVGADYAVVLANGSFMTIWFSPEPPNGCLVRWVNAYDEAAVIGALALLRDVRWEETGLEVRFWDDQLVLFDAACEGSDLPYQIEIEMPAGNYRIQTCHYKPDGETHLILHRFV